MKGIIYEIKCNETNEIYIGSTTRPIKERIRKHIRNDNCCSMQILERNNYSVNILEELEFIDTKELRIREQNYIDTIICINKIKAYRSDEEKLKGYERDKYKKNEYNKQYYQKNKIKSNII